MLNKFKLITISCFVFSIFSSAVIAETNDFKPSYKPTLEVPKISGKIKIDGEFSEDAWNQAAVADNFAETQPNDQTKPAVESKAFIMYDDKNLYVALIAYDDPSTIRTSYSDRDEIFRDESSGCTYRSR